MIKIPLPAGTWKSTNFAQFRAKFSFCTQRHTKLYSKLAKYTFSRDNFAVSLYLLVGVSFTQLSSQKFSCPNYAKIEARVFFLNTACLAPMIQRTCERSSALWFSSSGSPVYVSILVNFKQYNCHDHCWNALLFATETTNFVHTKNSEVQIFAYFLRYFHQNRTRERATCRNSAKFSFREVRTFFWVGIKSRRLR